MSEEKTPTSEHIPKDVPKRLRNFLVWAHASRHLLTALAALIAAMAALFKPQDHKVAKNTYEATSAGITKLEEQIKKNHEDIVTLRGYIDGVLRQNLSAEPVEQPLEAPAPAPTLRRITRTPAGIGYGRAAGAAAPAPASAAPISLPPLPPVHDQPTPWKAPTFDALVAETH